MNLKIKQNKVEYKYPNIQIPKPGNIMSSTQKKASWMAEMKRNSTPGKGFQNRTQWYKALP